MQSKKGSSSYYQEQIRQPSDEELFLALKEEIKRDNEAIELWWPNKETNMETKMDAKLIADMNTNLINLNRKLCAMIDRLAIQVMEQAKEIKEKFSRKLPKDLKHDDICESENTTLSLEDELLNPTLDKNKDIMECDKMPLVEKNELAIDEEPSLKEKQVEKKNLKLIMENVLVGIEEFNFPIDSLTFGMEEDRQVSIIEKPSIATSQVWIDAEIGEMILLFGEEEMKFNLHQSIPLMDEEMRACMKI